MQPTPTLSYLYSAWLARKGLTAKAAAHLIGLAPSTSYEYASGFSVPSATRLPAFARAIGESPGRLSAIAERDRPGCRRRRAQRGRP